MGLMGLLGLMGLMGLLRPGPEGCGPPAGQPMAVQLAPARRDEFQ